MPSISWTAEADRKLLFFIVNQPDVKVNAAGAAAMMSTATISCTENAIKKRLQRLREWAKASKDGEEADAGASAPGTPNKATPVKAKATSAKNPPAKAKGGKGGKGGKKRAKAQDEDDEDEESPKKKGKSDEGVKAEPVEDDFA